MVRTEKILCLTVDLEECTLSQEFGGRPLPEEESIRLSAQGARRLLGVIKSANVKATFFTTGFFASRCPELAKEIIDLGNEVANHGLKHYPQNAGGCVEKLRSFEESGDIIKRVAGKGPVGYREPLLNIGLDAIEALKRLNYIYDSSVLPTYVPGRYNRLRMRPAPFLWGSDAQGQLIEIPISVTPLLRIPVGWWWFRKNFGQRTCEMGFEAIWRRNLPVICHIHPWELVDLPEMPRIPIHVRFNCGAKSDAQIREIIAYGKRAKAEFVTMIDLAERLLRRMQNGRRRSSYR